jgi:hypothetical protein
MEEKLHAFFRHQTTVNGPPQQKYLSLYHYLKTDLPTEPSMKNVKRITRLSVSVANRRRRAILIFNDALSSPLVNAKIDDEL